MSEWCYAIKQDRVRFFRGEDTRSGAAAGLNKALPLLWQLVDEAKSHSTLGIFLRMPEWIRAQAPRGVAHHESCSPP